GDPPRACAPQDAGSPSCATAMGTDLHPACTSNSMAIGAARKSVGQKPLATALVARPRRSRHARLHHGGAESVETAKERNSANSAPPRRTVDTGFGATRVIGFRKQENFTA